MELGSDAPEGISFLYRIRKELVGSAHIPSIVECAVGLDESGFFREYGRILAISFIGGNNGGLVIISDRRFFVESVGSEGWIYWENDYDKNGKKLEFFEKRENPFLTERRAITSVSLEACMNVDFEFHSKVLGIKALLP